jgi:heme/copper-type cytochrome/quinol oxidase subunit 2
LKITPNKAGEYRIVCNEYCGLGHHNMLGSIVVEPSGAADAAAASGGWQ